MLLKFQTVFSFRSKLKCWLSRMEFTKYLRIENREDPDLGLHCLSRTFWQATCVKIFRNLQESWLFRKICRQPKSVERELTGLFTWATSKPSPYHDDNVHQVPFTLLPNALMLNHWLNMINICPRKKIGECHEIAYGFPCLWYKYEVREFSPFVRFTFNIGPKT